MNYEWMGLLFANVSFFMFYSKKKRKKKLSKKLSKEIKKIAKN